MSRRPTPANIIGFVLVFLVIQVVVIVAVGVAVGTIDLQVAP